MLLNNVINITLNNSINAMVLSISLMLPIKQFCLLYNVSKKEKEKKRGNFVVINFYIFKK